MSKPYKVPAQGTIEYTYFVVPTGFTEDKWVDIAEVRPGNRAVVHHVIAYVREPGSEWLSEAKPGEAYVPQKVTQPTTSARPAEYFVGYTPGKPEMRLRPGQAELIFEPDPTSYFRYITRRTEQKRRIKPPWASFSRSSVQPSV